MREYYENNLYSIEKIGILYNSTQMIDMLLNDRHFKIPFNSITVKKGELVVSKNEQSEFVYFIRKGIVALKHENYIFDFLKPNDFVGLYELSEKENSIFDIVAVKETELVRFKKADILWKVLSYQEGLFYYLHNMNKILIKSIEKQSILLMFTEKKIIVSLINLLERFGNATEEGYSLPKEFTNKLISEYTKCHLTTMFTIFKDLQSSRAIVSTGKPYVYNIDRLKQLEKSLNFQTKKGVRS
ncbi:Crp/Fnr family transcriptional regulator [Carnobacterium maltaromaticum]|uniref:Crp/Fnr family transcriptional regulator n=1 Tax=Carnobacterium maltaromaticum TaxID=2751 RepID=UPI0012F97FFD|nr:Crp/Fnr family transcriptional regulator [Carnobacterium maltaromaticum]